MYNDLNVKDVIDANRMGVAGGLLVKALDYGSKDPGFQSH